MPEYNGHKNWNHWNVSLWINNDEGLYSLAEESLRGAKTKDQAALVMLEALRDGGLEKTPDGAPYSLSSIRRVMASKTALGYYAATALQ